MTGPRAGCRGLLSHDGLGELRELHLDERGVNLLGDRLGCHGLADTRVSGEKDDETATLSVDDIVKHVAVLELVLYKRQDEVLVALGENKAVKRAGVPLNIADAVDVERVCCAQS